MIDVQTVRIPADCTDGFGGAYWARPEFYLEPQVQAGMSMLAILDPRARADGTERLRQSLATGQWDSKYGHLRNGTAIDLGYRLVIAENQR
jgi:hypothetical protein